MKGLLIIINREELVNRISSKYNTTKADTKLWVDAVFDVLGESVVEDKVLIRNFGSFEMKRQAPRAARDLMTNETMYLPARYKLVFEPCMAIKNYVTSISVE